MINGQCISVDEITTDEDVCAGLVPGGNCLSCYEYTGHLSDTTKYVCDDCTTKPGYFKDTVPNDETFFELSVCKKDDTAPNCEDSADEVVKRCKACVE